MLFVKYSQKLVKMYRKEESYFKNIYLHIILISDIVAVNL
jgi:hypothetical protein